MSGEPINDGTRFGWEATKRDDGLYEISDEVCQKLIGERSQRGDWGINGYDLWVPCLRVNQIHRVLMRPVETHP